MQRHTGLKIRRGVVLVIKVFAAVLLAFIVLVLTLGGIFRDTTSPPPIKSIIILIVFCLYGLTFDKLNAWYWSWAFRKRPEADMEIVFKFSDTQINIQSSLATSDVSWKIFYKVVEIEDGFLFYWRKKSFTWIPLTAFESQECITTVRRLIAEHGY